MSADLHVDGIDFQEYLDNPDEVLADYPTEPAIDTEPLFDITQVRDSGRVPDHVKEVLYQDTIEPGEALLVSDALHKIILERMGDLPDDLKVVGSLAIWLRYWAEQGHSISGMH